MAAWTFGSDGCQSVTSQESGQSVTSSKSRTSRRNRYKAANEYLQSALADFKFQQEPHSNEHGKDHSSDVLEPSLDAGALTRVVGIMVADKISRTVVDLKRQLSKRPFVSVGSPDGGSVADIVDFLAASLEAMNLGDRESGCILVDAYHYLQEDDLPLSSQTWRALLMTSLQAAAETVLVDRRQRTEAMLAVQSQAAHWWTLTQASKALKVFTQREAFKQLSPSQRADMYFELRQVAQGMMSQNDRENTMSTTVNLMDSDPSIRNSSGSFQHLLPGVRKSSLESSLEMPESVLAPAHRSSIISL